MVNARTAVLKVTGELTPLASLPSPGSGPKQPAMDAALSSAEEARCVRINDALLYFGYTNTKFV